MDQFTGYVLIAVQSIGWNDKWPILAKGRKIIPTLGGVVEMNPQPKLEPIKLSKKRYHDLRVTLYRIFDECCPDCKLHRDFSQMHLHHDPSKGTGRGADNRIHWTCYECHREGPWAYQPSCVGAIYVLQCTLFVYIMYYNAHCSRIVNKERNSEWRSAYNSHIDFDYSMLWRTWHIRRINKTIEQVNLRCIYTTIINDNRVGVSYVMHQGRDNGKRIEM